MFLKNCWYVAALDHELIDGKLLSRTLLGENVLLYRGESGNVIALNDRCPHRGALLSKGRLEAAKADPALIIDLPYLSDPNWKGIPAYLHYDANYLLIVDNLSDFSHLAFVHTKTLGGSEEYAFVTKPTVVERLERGFRVERWHLDSDPPPFHKKVIRNKSVKVDRRNIATMVIPGIFTMETLFAPAGQGAQAGNVAGAKEYRNCQFMTPETERTTHFFWSYLNNFEGEDSTISLSLLDSLIEGFMEDKEIIERQQSTLEEDPKFQMLAILADAPLAHFRRVLDRLVNAEKDGAAGQSIDPRQTTTAVGQTGR